MNTEEIKNIDMPVSATQAAALNLKAAVGSGLILLASKAGVSGAALATTALTFAAGIALNTHTPLHVIFKFASGTLGIGVARIKTTSSYLLTASALLALTTTDNNFIAPLLGAATNSGDISVEVTTASLGASSFDVFVFGIAKP